MTNWLEYVPASSELLQGDILLDFPVMVNDPEMDYSQLHNLDEMTVYVEPRNLIVLTQSCDIETALGKPTPSGKQPKADYGKLILLCRLFDMRSFNTEGVRSLLDNKSNSLHLINKHEEDNRMLLDYSVVSFGTFYSLPIGFIMNWLSKTEGNRPRLLAPYREELSQRFGIQFMRVGTVNEDKIIIEDAVKGLARAKEKEAAEKEVEKRSKQ